MKSGLYKTKKLAQETKEQSMNFWVKSQNKKSLGVFKSHPRFEELRDYHLNLM